MAHPDKRYFAALTVFLSVASVILYYVLSSWQTLRHRSGNDVIAIANIVRRGQNGTDTDGRIPSSTDTSFGRLFTDNNILAYAQPNASDPQQAHARDAFNRQILLVLSEVHNDSNLVVIGEDGDAITANINVPSKVLSILRDLKLPKVRLTIISPNFLAAKQEKKNYISFAAVQDDETDRLWDDLKPGDAKLHIKVTLHHVIIRCGSFHIIINKLYRRDNFYFIEPVAVADYSSPARAFFRYHRSTWCNFKPRNLDSFLWHYEFSELIGCNARLRESFGSSHKAYMNDSRRTVTDYRFSGILEFRDMFLEKKMPIMLWAGSLLGWYRHCDTIHHSHDADFALLEQFYDASVEQDIACSRNFSFKFILGKRADSLEMTVIFKSDFPIDLFLLYPQAEHMYDTILDFGGHKRYRCLYPNVTDICSGELRGHLFYVPCNFEEEIQVDYGYNWMSAFKGYNYLSDAKNTVLDLSVNKDNFDGLTTHPTCQPRERSDSSSNATASDVTYNQSIAMRNVTGLVQGNTTI